MSNKNLTRLFAALGALALAPSLGGCGGGQNSPSGAVQNAALRQTRVPLRISWPAAIGKAAGSRYIPGYAPSLFFQLYLQSDPSKRYNLVVNRPSSLPSTQDVQFSQLLNEGAYVLAGAARSLADGQGATVASAVVTVNVKAGMSPVALTLASTIKTILIVGQPLTAVVGQQSALQAGAYDPDGNAVLLPGGALTWSIVTGNNLGAITPDGKLTPTGAGTIRVQVAETGAGVNAQADVTVTAQGVTTGLADSGWPKVFGDAQNTGQTSGQGALGNIAWTYDAGGPVYSAPAVGKSNLVFVNSFVGSGVTLNAIHTDTGKKAWAMPTPVGGLGMAPLVGQDNTVYVAGSSGVAAYDAGTGLQKWYNPNWDVVGDLALDTHGHLYAPVRYTGISVISTVDGKDVTSYSFSAAQFTLGPALSSGGILVYLTGQQSYTAVAVDTATGKKVWSWPVPNANGGSLTVPPIIAPDGNVYIAAGDGKLYGLDLATSATKVTSTNASGNAIAVGKDNTFYAGGLVKAVNVSSDQIAWTSQTVFASSVLAVGPDKTVYTGSGSGKVYALKGTDGSTKWTVDVQDATARFLGGVAVGSDGAVYVGSDKHKVYAIK
jgi:outer membrane protein assembly factor BamB